MRTHRCKAMKDEIETFFQGEIAKLLQGDEDIPIQRIEKGPIGWLAWGKNLGMKIRFCPFCGVDLATTEVAPKPGACSICSQACRCTVHYAHRCGPAEPERACTCSGNNPRPTSIHDCPAKVHKA